MEKVVLDRFVKQLKADVCKHNGRYVFFLGAGCSITSGIPAAGGLTTQWMAKLAEEQGQSPSACIATYDSTNPAMSYGDVLEALFPEDHLRQQEIERICAGASPNFGYCALATLVAHRDFRNNFPSILTTNFDDLIAEAFYRHTTARPLIIDHESLAGFVGTQASTPVVLKIHGDHRLAPRNTKNEFEQLAPALRGAIERLVQDKGIIFVGYSGNDKGVADALGHFDKGRLRRVYWISSGEPGPCLRQFLDKHSAWWVEHRDFDHLMLALQHHFEVGHPDRQRLDDYAKRYVHSLAELTAKALMPEGILRCKDWPKMVSALRSHGLLTPESEIVDKIRATELIINDRDLEHQYGQTKDWKIALERAALYRPELACGDNPRVDAAIATVTRILKEVLDDAPNEVDVIMDYAEFAATYLEGGKEEAIQLCDRALAIDDRCTRASELKKRILPPVPDPATDEPLRSKPATEENMTDNHTNWTPNATDDVVLSMHPLADGAWRRGALPDASALHLRELKVETPPANWHINEARTSPHWTEVEQRIHAQIAELERIPCTRIHVFANGPYALAALLGQQLDERLRRGGRRIVFYQYNPNSGIWEDWGPDRRIPTTRRDEPFFAPCSADAPDTNVGHIVLAFHISRELSREEMGRALAEQGAEQSLVWIDARPAEGVSQQALRDPSSVDRCVHEMDGLVFDTAKKYPKAKIHLFYSGPLAVLMRAAAKFHLLQTDATLYERIASEGGHILVPALDLRGAFRVRMGTAAVANESRSSALPQRGHVTALPEKLQVLAVATEWASRKGGLSTLNRNLCIALARAGHDVACLVPTATNDEQQQAEKSNVRLVVSKATAPEAARLFLKPIHDAVPAPHVVIGHGRVTGDAAQVQARDHFRESILVHFVHTMPNHIEWFKGDGISDDTSRKADERTKFERNLAAQADLVVGVGPRLTTWITDELVTGLGHETTIFRLDPGLNDISPVTRKPTGIHCLLLGRAEDWKLKGFDLALRALQTWPEQPPELVIRGVPRGSAAEFAEWVRSVAPRVNVRPFDYAEDEETIEIDIRKASIVLMPSREEGFGLVGLEAISAAVPVLVSGRSGLGEVLLERGTESAKRAVVQTFSADDDADIAAWQRAIGGVLRNRDAAYADAKCLREELTSVFDWNSAAEKLISEVRMCRQSTTSR